jgi:UPF0716 protein FxsA
LRRLGIWFFDRRLRKMAAASPYAHLFPPQGGFADEATRLGGRRQPGPVVHGEVIREDREP